MVARGEGMDGDVVITMIVKSMVLQNVEHKIMKILRLTKHAAFVEAGDSVALHITHDIEIWKHLVSYNTYFIRKILSN